MNQRIRAAFEQLGAEGRTALIPFMTAGDPVPEGTVEVMHALVEAGADLLELGVPFSDPMADGPVIQLASERAIEKGVSLRTVLDDVTRFRQSDHATPVILMGYLNPVERMGHLEFAEAADQAGVDGVLLVDCPPEERGDLGPALAERDIDAICMAAPTTTEKRMSRFAKSASGFVYYVSFKGITGAGGLNVDSLAGPVDKIRAHFKLPVAVGFGIKDPVSARDVSGIADGVVIGSALVERLAATNDIESACKAARQFLAPIRRSMDNDCSDSAGAGSSGNGPTGSQGEIQARDKT